MPGGLFQATTYYYLPIYGGMDSDPMAPILASGPLPCLQFPTGKSFPGGPFGSVLSEHKLQAMTEEPLKSH